MTKARRITESIWFRLAVVTCFAAGMAFVESAVVVYLRELFGIAGEYLPVTPPPESVWFSVPFFTLLEPGATAAVLPTASIAWTEVGREAATIVMLACVGWLAGRDRRSRFAFFIHAFGVWDVLYYAFLRALIGWPGSLATPDVLFLIPGPWVGPVFLPMLVSVGMILTAVLVLRRGERAASAV